MSKDAFMPNTCKKHFCKGRDHWCASAVHGYLHQPGIVLFTSALNQLFSEKFKKESLTAIQSIGGRLP